MTHQPVRQRRLLSTERFSVDELSYRSSDGAELDRAVIRHPGAVVILPLIGQERVCLIRNYRLAVGRTLLEVPAGTLVPGEEPLAAARRELAEETGYRGGKWQLLQRFYASPGILDERMHLYLASELEPGPPAREPGEEIENVLMDADEALRLVREGQIEDGKTIVALLLWQAGLRGDPPRLA